MEHRAFDEQGQLKVGPKTAEQPPDGLFDPIRPLWLGKQLILVSTGGKAGNGTGWTVRLRYFPPPYDKRTKLVDALPAGETAEHRVGAAATDGSNIFIGYVETEKSSLGYKARRPRALLVDSQGQRLARTAGIPGFSVPSRQKPRFAAYHRGHYVLLVGISLVVYDSKLKLLMPPTKMQYGSPKSGALYTIVGLYDLGQDLLLVYWMGFSATDTGTWMMRIHLDGL